MYFFFVKGMMVFMAIEPNLNPFDSSIQQLPNFHYWSLEVQSEVSIQLHASNQMS